MIKVISITPLENGKQSLVRFSNADSVGIMTGKLTKMNHQELCWNDKINVSEGEVLPGYEIQSQEFTTPQYVNKKTGEEHKGLEVTRNGKTSMLYFTTKLVAK